MEIFLMAMNLTTFTRLAEAHFFLHNAPEKKLTALPNLKMPATPHQWVQVASLAKGSHWILVFDELQMPKSWPEYGELRPLRINNQVQWQNKDSVYSRLVYHSQLCCWLPHHSLAGAYIPQQTSWGQLSGSFPSWQPSAAEIAGKSAKTKRKVTVRKSRAKGKK